MRNNSSCRMVSVESVRIMMYHEVVRTISDVRHVPQLHKILLSVNAK